MRSSLNSNLVRRMVRGVLREVLSPDGTYDRIEDIPGYKSLMSDIKNAPREGRDPLTAEQQFVRAVKDAGFSTEAAWSHLDNLRYW